MSPATKVTWSGDGVAIETPRGTLRAAAIIITVSTGVLAAGHICFDPPLPASVQHAIQAPFEQVLGFGKERSLLEP